MSLRRSGVFVIAALATSAGLSPLAKSQEADPPVGNLAAKYKLVERFTTQESKLGYVSQYQVAFRETISTDSQGGYSRTIQFSERPASATDDRRPTEIVRHYDSFRSTPAVNDKSGRRLLDDLTIWCREVPGKPPLVISLTPNRSLHEKEYEFAVTNHYVSKLTFVLSNDPVRLLDTWRVSPAGTVALTNLTDVVEGTLTATLSEVRAHPAGTGRQAVIKVVGRLQQDPQKYGENDTTVNAELLFAFTPTAPPGGGEGNVIDGFGAIENLRMTQKATLVDPATKKKPWMKRELVLERRFPGTDPILPIPEPPPTATVENSWLTSNSANGEFSFRHPQEYEMKIAPKRTNEDEKAPRQVFLIAPNPDGGGDLITFDYYNTIIRPEAVFDQLKAEWSQKKIDIIPGLTHRLPEADWPGMAVHHMESVLKLPAQGPDAPSVRRYSDCYVIQFARTGSIVVTGNTFSENPGEFRKQIEAILKTLKLGAS